MQKSFPLLTLLCLLAMANLQARSPEQFNYQAVVRDVSGNSLAAGVHVSVWFEIHDGPAPGPVVFTETTTAITNRFGLINRPVGSLTDLPAVNRASGGKYRQVRTDPTGAAAATGTAGAAGGTGAEGVTGTTGATGHGGQDGTNGTGATEGTGPRIYKKISSLRGGSATKQSQSDDRT